jgi:hypothetical protein
MIKDEFISYQKASSIIEKWNKNEKCNSWVKNKSYIELKKEIYGN